MLLDAALEQCTWDLARELVRFLTAIGAHLYLIVISKKTTDR